MSRALRSVVLVSAVLLAGCSTSVAGHATRARARYTEVAARWQQCQASSPVTQRENSVTFIENISRITDSDGILTAELLVSSTDGLVTPIPNRRAITSTAQFLVDVQILGTPTNADGPTVAGDAVAVAGLVTHLLAAG